jgi:arginine deiminase
VSHSTGADSETGWLRTVLMHRPGAELRRLTPRTASLLRSGGLPWLAQAQREHDALTNVLREYQIDVIYLAELLADVLDYESARTEAIGSLLARTDLGADLATAVRRQLDRLSPRELVGVLTAGLTHDELRAGRGLVYDLLEPRDFVIDPLPNLTFCRDAGFWIGDQVVVAALAGARRRECDLLATVYRHHPRFARSGAGACPPYLASGSCLDGGDVVQFGSGVVAVGVGVRSTPASVESLARHLLDTGAAQQVLAVPMNQRRPPGADAVANHFDLACTVVDSGVVLMAPGTAFSLTALTLSSIAGELRVSRPRPFLEAAAQALGLDRLTVIDTGIESEPAGSGQWDDGGNVLAIGDRIILSDERNTATNVRLSAAGFTVRTVPSGELSGLRGGPRAKCAPLVREPAGQQRPAGRETGHQPRAQSQLPLLPAADDRPTARSTEPVPAGAMNFG